MELEVDEESTASKSRTASLTGCLSASAFQVHVYYRDLSLSRSRLSGMTVPLRC
jgi:hypothetical protein